MFLSYVSPKQLFWVVLICGGIIFYQLMPYHFFRPIETEIPERLAFSKEWSRDLRFAPGQFDLNKERRSFAHGDVFITPVAGIQVEARVLGKKAYRWGAESRFSPVDLALGWGPMREERNLEGIRIRQSGRFYFWSVREFPIPQRQIEINSANMHLIPASKEVARELFWVRNGDIVRFEGYLVNLDALSGWYWRTSTTRTDTGGGACEIVLVTWLDRVSE